MFERSEHHAIESAMSRAIGLWHDYPEDFRYLALNGIRVDRSWARPGQDYLNITSTSATSERQVIRASASRGESSLI